MRTSMIILGVIAALAVAVVPGSASIEDYSWVDEPAPSREQVCDCNPSASDQVNTCSPCEGRGPAESETPETEYESNF